MTFYELALFVHIAATVIWVGSGFLLPVLGLMASRTDDDARLERILADNEALATRLFIPSSLTVLAAGVALMIDGSWSFAYLWLVLGLIGYLATFVTGLFVLKPHGERIHAMTERAGGMTDAALGVGWAIARARAIPVPAEAGAA